MTNSDIVDQISDLILFHKIEEAPGLIDTYVHDGSLKSYSFNVVNEGRTKITFDFPDGTSKTIEIQGEIND